MPKLSKTKLSFRVYFALQQAVLLEKSRGAQNQIFCRLSIPEELQISGSFTSFVSLLSQLIGLGIHSYCPNVHQKLVFVTADWRATELTIRITDGGSGLRYQTSIQMSDGGNKNGAIRPQLILLQAERLIHRNFHGSLSLRSFSNRGTQVTLKLPVPSDSQNLDKS
ncbi:MAG TPA: hypothetical protein DEP87_00270 [Candidatus Pacebacteria bacterium]|nr:hypothetical protein [Candidatus Paceibacterota bacterium]